MRKFIATAAAVLVSALTFGDRAQAQNPYRGNGVNGIYVSGWSIYGNYVQGDYVRGTYIQGNYIHGTYIAPPSSVVYYTPVQNYVPVQPTWTTTYPVYYYPNYSSVIPTNYNWRYYGR